MVEARAILGPLSTGDLMRSAVVAPVSLILVILAVLAASGCEELRRRLYTPRIKVRCDILRKECLFTNHGDPGGTCVIVEVFHFGTGRVLKSAPVCSGHMERDQPTPIGVEFPGGDPVLLCMGQDMGQDFKKNCRVEVRDVEEE